MSMTDPIADLLSRIRNAQVAKHDRLDVPASKLKLEVVKLLKEEGFIKNFREIEGTPVGTLRVFLRYTHRLQFHHFQYRHRGFFYCCALCR